MTFSEIKEYLEQDENHKARRTDWGYADRVHIQLMLIPDTRIKDFYAFDLNKPVSGYGMTYSDIESECWEMICAL